MRSCQVSAILSNQIFFHRKNIFQFSVQRNNFSLLKYFCVPSYEDCDREAVEVPYLDTEEVCEDVEFQECVDAEVQVRQKEQCECE